jgi:hypothetical protein
VLHLKRFDSGSHIGLAVSGVGIFSGVVEYFQGGVGMAALDGGFDLQVGFGPCKIILIQGIDTRLDLLKNIPVVNMIPLAAQVLVRWIKGQFFVAGIGVVALMESASTSVCFSFSCLKK